MLYVCVSVYVGMLQCQFDMCKCVSLHVTLLNAGACKVHVLWHAAFLVCMIKINVCLSWSRYLLHSD